MAKAKITRIKANDSKNTDSKADEPVITRKKVVLKDKKQEKTEKKLKKEAEKSEKKNEKKAFILFRPFVAVGHYLRDSWREIRQVRWPNRKATWKMVLAVIVYTAIFATILVLLDMLFQFIFSKILG